MSKNNTPTIGCAILTYRATNHLPNCLKFIRESSLNPRILVLDSSSHDGTVEMAKALGAETLVIPKRDFNHGTTRELARKNLNTDIICMFTQDAYLADVQTLQHLVAPLIQKHAAVAYARQIPHPGANFFEAFARAYNYPETSHVRGLKDIAQYGVYTFFCSDSCAAYSNAALEEIGGFEEVLLGEDTVATAKLLRKGHQIAYVAEAQVRHSHRYSLWEEFCRNFDTGLAREDYAELLSCPSGDTKRGFDFAKTLMKKSMREKPYLLPYAFAHIVAKWSGYQLGKRSLNAPVWFKKALSSQKFYWTSSAFLNKKK